MEFLDKIRTPEKPKNIQRQILCTAGIFILGICLGAFSKFLDYRQAELPAFIQAFDRALDFHNFLGSFAPWIVIAVCISVYSRTPVRAAVNVFSFFTGYVGSYYIYCKLIAGFFPKSYAMIWIGFTVISPVLAFICWYARGRGVISFILSSGIIAVLINTAFSYGMFYIDIRSWLNILMLISGIAVVHKSQKETVLMLGTGVVFALLLHAILPFRIW